MTTIQWTDESSNPLKVRRISDGKLGWFCRKISPGCLNCYSATMNERQGTNPGRHGTGHEFKLSEARHLEPVLIEKELDRIARARKPRRWFVCDMTDFALKVCVCENGHAWETGAGDCPTCDALTDRAFWPYWMRRKCFDAWAVAGSRGQTIQILTKRPETLASSKAFWHREQPARSPVAPKYPEAVPGWWLGVSVENKAERERIETLRGIPAEIRFLSCEPLLEDLGTLDLSGIGWVIVGGESGPGSRPCRLPWVDSIVAQCRAAGVAVFCKQLGSNPHFLSEGETKPLFLRDKKGGDPTEWPGRLERFPREMPDA